MFPARQMDYTVDVACMPPPDDAQVVRAKCNFAID